MESTLIEAIRREEVITKHWDCKLVFKEEQDGLEIDLLEYVNLSKEEEDKIAKNSSYPTFCLYTFPGRFNGLKDWAQLRKEILYSSAIARGFKMTPNTATPRVCGKKYNITCVQKGAANKTYFYTKHTEVYTNSKNDNTKSPATMKNKLFLTPEKNRLYPPLANSW
jgi:hypothetical protein